MNKDRRKSLGNLIDRLAKITPQFAELQPFRDKLGGLKDEAEDINSTLTALKDEEQEAYEALSENLQGGERGQTMQEAVSEMETAIQSLETVADKLDELLGAFDEVQTEIESVAGSIDNARGQA